jgi:hypothetical protein
VPPALAIPRTQWHTREIQEAPVSNEKEIELTLKVDDQEIVIGPFVQEIVSSGILGMIGSLKGVDDPKKVEILIELE